MTGSAINIGSKNILPGNALAENDRGVFLADSDNPAFAVATDGGPSGTIIAYSDDGIIERTDWSAVADAPKLRRDQKYFLLNDGKIGTSGTQQIGIARSPTQLRVGLQTNPAPLSNMWPLSAPPDKSLGKVKDFALDQNTLALYLKAATGWAVVGYLVKTMDTQYLPITVFNTFGNGWSFSPSS